MSKLQIAPETIYTDIEHDFIENEPPGLFPGDQRSVWGEVRSAYGAYLQVLADTLTKWYGNLDPSTVSSDDIPEWEYMLNLPQSNTALTDTARRNNVVARFGIGPFTRTRRQQIVESFITQTFGAAITFDPTGVPFVSAGTPFYSGAGSLAGTYTIRENLPYGRNLVANSNFETNTTGWVGGASTIARVTTDFMFGAACLQVTATGASAQFTYSNVVAGSPIAVLTYTASMYVKGVGSTIGKTLYAQINANGGSFANTGIASNSIVLTGQWQRITLTGTVDHADRTSLLFFGVVNASVSGDVYLVDGVQFEQGSTANPYVDAQATSFSYEVRILNTITIDTLGLTRELTRITPAGITFTLISTATP